MKFFYTEDGYSFVQNRSRALLLKFLDHPDWGRVWVAETNGNIVGYLIVCLGFSFEYGGRDAFIDELYIDEAHRGLGLGRMALEVAEAYCREQGVVALHLEVEPHRTRAATLYAQNGYTENGRRLLNKTL